MALSGVHQSPICVVINEDPFASDMAAYNAWLHAVNGILVRAFFRSEGVCVWQITTHCRTGDNYSDMMTKVLYGQKKRDNGARILYDIWDHEDGPETTKG